MSDERRYSEREVAEIVRLATEGKGEPASSGMTLREIQAVVAELGLDPQKVREAASHVDAGLPESHINGSSTEFLRTYDGELDDDGWEEMVLLMRRRSGSNGEVSQRGSTREWKGLMADIENYHLSATVKNGKTRVRVTQDVSGSVVLTWIVTALPILLGPVIILTKSFKAGLDMTWPIITSALLVALIVGAASYFTKRHKRRAANLGQILEEFEPLIGRRSSPSTAQAEAQTQAVEDDIRLHLGQAE